MNKITEHDIKAMLFEQNLEFASNFEPASKLIAQTVCNTPEVELLDAGESLIDSCEVDRRILGTRLIREVKDNRERAIELLRHLLLRECDEAVIYWVIGAFGFQKSDSVTEEILAFRTHPNPGIRYNVATAICNTSLPDLLPQSLEALIVLCHDENSEVRFSAVFELGAWWQQVKDHRMELQLRQALSDSDSYVVRAAQDALNESG